MINESGQQITSTQEEIFIQEEIPKMITLMNRSRVPNRFSTIYKYFSFNCRENGDYAIIPLGYGCSDNSKTVHGDKIKSRLVLSRNIAAGKWKIWKSKHSCIAIPGLDINELDSDWVKKTKVLRPKIKHLVRSAGSRY